MEYIEKSDNVEKVYSVYYDKEKLNELLDKIVRNASYKNDCEYTIRFQPSLAYIIQRILVNDPDSIYEFLNYETNDELVPIDKKIEAASKAVDEIDNFDFDKKIEAIKRLKKIYTVKKEKKYFDTELLKQYYLQAYSLFELELKSVKTIKKNSGRVLLKDYKKLKQ